MKPRITIVIEAHISKAPLVVAAFVVAFVVVSAFVVWIKAGSAAVIPVGVIVGSSKPTRFVAVSKLSA